MESRRHTPSLPADEVAALIASKANIAILDVRRFDEYATMNIPGSVSVPGAELVLRAREAAPDPETTIIVNCAGRTRSIIGTQSLINAGVANKVVALRNGTIGWTLAKQDLEHGADRRGGIGAFDGARKPMPATSPIAPASGVSAWRKPRALEAQNNRTLYRFDVRDAGEYAAGHIAGFRHYAGGQLVQEIDMAAPVRGARILLTDDRGIRADMTASWLAQMGWETLCARRRLRRRAGSGPAAGAAKTRSVTSLPPSLRGHRCRSPRRCRPISIGNTAWSSSSAATPRTGFLCILKRDAIFRVHPCPQ